MRLTIGIPFRNAEATLPDALRSVFAQTFTDWELILMDDGSSDGSAAIARSVRDPRVTVVSDGEHRGLCRRLNQIAGLAGGEYLARMDADDLMHPDRLRRQVQFLDDNPAVDVVSTAAYTIDRDNKPWGLRGDRPLDASPAAVVTRGLFIHPTVAGRTAWFRRYPYDPEFVRAEDLELWCRTCRHSRFATLADPLLFYREPFAGNLPGFLQSSRTCRKVYRLHGPASVGRGRTALLIARSWLKSACYRVATPLGLQGRLIRRRNRLLRPGEAEEARAVLARVLRTPVPGRSDVPSPQAIEVSA